MLAFDVARKRWAMRCATARSARAAALPAATGRCASIRATTPSPTRSTRRSQSCGARRGHHRGARDASVTGPRFASACSSADRGARVGRSRPQLPVLVPRSWRSRSSATAPCPYQRTVCARAAGSSGSRRTCSKRRRQSPRAWHRVARPHRGASSLCHRQRAENHDEEGVSSDPRHGENNTFYLQARRRCRRSEPRRDRQPPARDHPPACDREGFESLPLIEAHINEAVRTGSEALVLQSQT